MVGEFGNHCVLKKWPIFPKTDVLLSNLFESRKIPVRSLKWRICIKQVFFELEKTKFFFGKFEILAMYHYALYNQNFAKKFDFKI